MNLLQRGEQQYFGFLVLSSRTIRLYFPTKELDRLRITLEVGTVVPQHWNGLRDLYAALNAPDL